MQTMGEVYSYDTVQIICDKTSKSYQKTASNHDGEIKNYELMLMLMYD